MPYRVHMRNTSGPTRGNWATFSKAAREGALLNKAEMARRLGVDRGTIHRWETGQNKPESAELVASFARITGVDLDESLAAAGLVPGVDAPAEPTRERDEEVELVRSDPTLSPNMKVRIVKMILDRRERDLEETRRIIDLFKGDRSA